MNFDYTSIISHDAESGDYLLLRRPEIPITIHGPNGSMTLLGLVDTGSDNTVFPKSAADYLKIPAHSQRASTARVFGGQRVEFEQGEVILSLESDGEKVAWNATVCFFHFDSTKDDIVILGHDSFLDFFTATFNGELGTLQLQPNGEMPIVE